MTKVFEDITIELADRNVEFRGRWVAEDSVPGVTWSVAETDKGGFVFLQDANTFGGPTLKTYESLDAMIVDPDGPAPDLKAQAAEAVGRHIKPTVKLDI